MKDKAESVRQGIPWIESLDQRISKLEEKMEQLRKPHEEPVFGPESVWEPEQEPADPFADWPVKPGDWIQMKGTGDVLKLEDAANPLIVGLVASGSEALLTKSRVDALIDSGSAVVLTPAEVEAHERKLKYPVLAPGDVIGTRIWIGEVCPPRGIQDNGKLVVSGEWYTQDECRTKLESGEWVKYVREVKG